MNLIKEYRELFGYSQADCIERFKPLCSGIDIPLLSKMESGVCLPTDDITTFVLKELASQFEEGLWVKQTTLPLDLLNLLKEPIYQQVYSEVAMGTFDAPTTKDRLRAITGQSDRAVRKMIEEMRLCGARIVSTSGNKGYFIDNGYYYKVMRAELIGRARSLFKLVAAMDGTTEGQMELVI